MTTVIDLMTIAAGNGGGGTGVDADVAVAVPLMVPRLLVVNLH